MGNDEEGWCDGDIRDGDGGSPPPKESNGRSPAFSSNNFENYRRMKMQGSERNEGRRDATGPEEGRWNHFTAPLIRERPPHERQSRSSPMPESDRTTPKRSAPSAFSDLERSQTVDRFANIFMDRMGGVMSSGKLSRAWQGSDGGGSSLFSWLLTDHSLKGNAEPKTVNPDDYSTERRMIEPHLTPFVWGSSCMMVTLFSLRLGRWYQRGNVARTLGDNVNGMIRRTTDNNAKSLQDARCAQPHQRYNFSDKKTFNNSTRRELTDSLMTSLSTLPVDMALSMLVGISTTIFLTSSSNLMRDMSTSPLLEGKSALAEELCSPFREEMENVNSMPHIFSPQNADAARDVIHAQKRAVPYSDLWKDENLGEFDSLRAIRNFVSNCREREKVAKQMVAADGGDVNGQELMEVKIPPPGITPDFAAGEYDESDIIARTASFNHDE